ncbi:CVNH domain protein [Ceratobasidium sp. AG-Ba]|nr:CVNH domain protein [Ceratobasidium sp. AG-Ba]QRV91763.1 CVNH domain protein [Ceratobasidium sp. AG-Ba]
MSFSETCVRPRLLFGRHLQAHCEHEGVYRKSTIDLNDCLKNDNGNFTSNLSKDPIFDSSCDSDYDVHLDHGKIVAELPIHKRQKRNHATYDLDICLSNENGELKWKIQDGLFDRDGGITRAAEAIPGVGFIIALIHAINGSMDHAKRALVLCGKGVFAILFSIVGMALGGLDPAIISISALMSFLGTIIADLTIEAGGRSWIKNKRVAADIPDRSWKETLFDGFVAGAAVGAATGIAPHAEEATARVLKSAAIVPEEIALAEIELLSVQNLLYNAPVLGREIAKVATGGVVRATPAGIQLLAAQTPQATRSNIADGLNITLGKYYVANAQTGSLLEFVTSDETTLVQTSKPRFDNNQIWIVEQGSTGFTIKSSASGQYIGVDDPTIGTNSLHGVERGNAIELRIEGDHKQGFCFVVTDGPSVGLALDLESENDVSADSRGIKLSNRTDSLQQRWLLEEDCYPDTLERHRGPIARDSKLLVSDSSSGVPLRLEAPSRSAFLWMASNDRAPVWTLEPGFDGYYIKHIPSGRYLLAGSRQQDVNTLPLTFGDAETEFVLDGNDQDGYSLVYARDTHYGLEVDTTAPDANAQTVLLWKPDAVHSKWRIEAVA